MRIGRRGGITLLGAAVALLAIVALVGTSIANTRLYNASLSIGLNRVAGGDTASGRLKTVKPCLGGRVVTVFENVNPSQTFDYQALGKARTDSSGAWTLQIHGGIKKGDRYYARVSKRILVHTASKKRTCKGAFSAKVLGD
jgi:hypothetical protein